MVVIGNSKNTDSSCGLSTVLLGMLYGDPIKNRYVGMPTIVVDNGCCH